MKASRASKNNQYKNFRYACITKLCKLNISPNNQII